MSLQWLAGGLEKDQKATRITHTQTHINTPDAQGHGRTVAHVVEGIYEGIHQTAKERNSATVMTPGPAPAEAAAPTAEAAATTPALETGAQTDRSWLAIRSTNWSG